ncbi:alpha/beta fold hydrolase [Flavobacteriaceae bacterium R38]|nr:alpha/beta fold hydrolase [Flavobacteriaceae bacterium R38]
MIEEKNIILEGKHQKPILADVFLNDNTSKKPVVVFCHGYKGFKDWGSWDTVANAFANADFCFIKFNFSHNGGTVEQPIDFPDLDAFGNNNYEKELDDLETVLDWITNADFKYKDRIDSTKIILIGHSRGGGIVTIKAHEDRRVSHIISWAGVSDYGSRFGSEEAIALWEKEGVTYVKNGRTKQEMPLYYQFYENFKQNEARLNIKNAAMNLNIPHCIIHGDTDETVHLDEAKNLHQWNPKSEIFIIEDANHVFGGKHPWSEKTMPDHLNLAFQKSISFINNN